MASNNYAKAVLSIITTMIWDEVRVMVWTNEQLMCLASIFIAVFVSRKVLNMLTLNVISICELFAIHTIYTLLVYAAFVAVSS
jgi:hypothetical protein